MQARIRRGLRPISAAYASCIALYRRGACAGCALLCPFHLSLGSAGAPALHCQTVSCFVSLRRH